MKIIRVPIDMVELSNPFFNVIILFLPHPIPLSGIGLLYLFNILTVIPQRIFQIVSEVIKLAPIEYLHRP